ncbi:YqeG family HAD IIIA-type phosphatase [Acidobacteriota bacterium]
MSIRDLINIDFFFNLKLLFKFDNIIPTFEVDNLIEIADIIEKYDPDAVILDVDQTLVPFEEVEIEDEIRHFLKRISKEKRFCLLSNVPRTEKRIERIHIIEEQIGIRAVFADKRKPSPVAFRSALAFLDSEPLKALMIGDRIFTDIMGANNLGISTVLVPPLNPKTDPFLMVKLPRYFERFYLKFARWLRKSL